MYISKFNIKNYKSFLDSGEIEFKRGINIIIGQNHSGKTALLEALSHDYEQIIHQSEKVKPSAFSKGNTDYAYEVSRIVLEQAEIAYILRQSDFEYFVAQKELNNHTIIDGNSDDVSNLKMDVHIERRKCFLFQFGSYAEELPDNSQDSTIYIRRENGKFAEINSTDFNTLYPRHSPSLTLGEKVTDYILENIYMFQAERMSIGRSPLGTSRELKTNAENLPEVLNSIKTNNTFLFQQYVDLVNEVIPSVKDISIEMAQVGELNALNYQIRIWNLPSSSQREDLTVPLSQSGTGISQVLAILYIVLINKEQPKIIIIDEPNSFLHPGASKKLIQIFNRFPQYQYFISTHSPEIVSSAKPSTVTELKYIGGETKVKSVDLSNKSEFKNIFKELGISLGDFFFSDSILWVEGTTEEKAFPLILEHLGIENYTILSVMPSEIRNKKTARKNTKNVFKIYQQLSGTDALIPSNIAVILDREDYNEDDLRDDKKEFGENLHFIPVRMFENYLLDAEAITAIYNETTIEDAPSVTIEQVTEWIEDNKNNSQYASKSTKQKQLNGHWNKDIDGARFLNDLFCQLSDSKNLFYKTTHSVKLTEWLLTYKPEVLAELTDFLLEIINVER
jgi:predicted ATP-dependent endonuclease of OLD family